MAVLMGVGASAVHMTYSDGYYSIQNSQPPAMPICSDCSHYFTHHRAGGFLIETRQIFPAVASQSIVIVTLSQSVSRRNLAMCAQAHFAQLNDRDEAMSRSLNSDYLDQLLIRADTSRLDARLVAHAVLDRPLPEEEQALLVFKRGCGPCQGEEEERTLSLSHPPGCRELLLDRESS